MTKVTLVTCDGKMCYTSVETIGKKKKVTLFLTNLGWKIVDDKDYCPACSSEVEWPERTKS